MNSYCDAPERTTVVVVTRATVMKGELPDGITDGLAHFERLTALDIAHSGASDHNVS